MKSTAKPYGYDRSRVKIGWWNQPSRSNTCQCCGREIKRSCNLKLTAEDGATNWIEAGVACSMKIVECYSRKTA